MLHSDQRISSSIKRVETGGLCTQNRRVDENSVQVTPRLKIPLSPEVRHPVKVKSLLQDIRFGRSNRTYRMIVEFPNSGVEVRLIFPIVDGLNVAP